jgi:DNA modification methylase
MPSSAKDRFTVDFEYVFFFTKAKRYYFEQQFEAQSETESTQIRNKSTTNRIAPKYDVDRKLRPDKAEWTSQYRILPNGRNRRAVWRINPQPFKSAHFAVFPEKLVEPMILAGCPSAICDSCGAGYSLDNTFEYSGIKPKTNKRISGKTDLASGMTYPTFKDREHKIKRRNKKDLKEYLNNARKRAGYTINEVESILESQAPHHWFNGESYPAPGDWPRIKKLFNLTDNYDDTLTCDCNAPTHPGTVLDPFVGSGTTCLVARKLGRHYIGIDLNPDYCNMAEKRLREVL